MDRESEYLLHLMGAYLRNEAPRIRSDLDWTRIVDLAQIHSLVGVLGYMVTSYPLCSEEMSAGLRRGCMMTMAQFAHRTALAQMLCEELAGQGIDHILMKGYVLREYYPIPELRTFGDIDMVIRPSDREKSHALMARLGYDVKTDWEPVYSYTKANEHYELHTELMETDISERMDFRAYFRDLWQYAEPAGDHSYRFQPEFHFLYLLAHLAKHIRGSGAGIRMYMDVAVFIRHFGDTLDWAWIRKELEKLHFAEFANTVLAFIQKYFNVESPISGGGVEAAVLETLAEYTVSGGVFGRSGADSGTITLKQEKKPTSRLGTIAHRLFPPVRTIERRYTYLKKHPWLLPAAWIHRLVKSRSMLGQHASEARQILSADSDEVCRLRNMMKNIGLLE